MRSTEQHLNLGLKASFQKRIHRSAGLAACTVATALIVSLPVHTASNWPTSTNSVTTNFASKEQTGLRVLIDYIAHASFQLTSPEGTRVVLDPFNNHIWLGYQFPTGLEADLVLVSHPHYDHNASYSVDGDPVVFRRPVNAQFNDVKVFGAQGRHSEPYGKEFGRHNTVWKIETGGLSLVHWGDNGPITEALVTALGNVDVLFLPVDGDQHILKDSEVGEILRRLSPGILIPMHYKIPSLSTEPRNLGAIGPWLDRVSRTEAKNRTVGSSIKIRRSKASRLEIEKGTLPRVTEIVILEPNPRVTAWPAEYRESLSLMKQALELQTSDPHANAGGGADRTDNTRTTDEASIALLEASLQTYSRSIRIWRSLAEKQLKVGRTNQAISTLETGLIRAARDDWTSSASARVLLGELYARQGHPEQAIEQFRWVLEHCANLNLRSRAKVGLANDP